MTNKRKRHSDEHDNADRWVVSYADFITLLFAFFTTMYAISHVDMGKLEMFAGSMKSAFKGTGMAAPGGAIIEGIRPANYDDIRLENAVRTRLDKSGIINGIAITRSERGVSLSIEDSLIFDSGSASIKEDARPFLESVAALIRVTRNPIVIEGHTDAIPIRNSKYASNWELSTARATSAVLFFTRRCGLGPERFAAAGYGEFRPVASNATAPGRAKNRRVDIIFAGERDRTGHGAD